MSFVFVLDQEKRPLDPIHPGRARYLLQAGHAAVYRRYPFTLIMKEAKPDATAAPLRVKIDTGSTVTGLAVVNDATGQVVWAAELTHHGQEIREKLARRSEQRHLAKTHWLDAACVGASTPEHLTIQGIVPLLIRSTGRQRRQMCLINQYGFPRTRRKGPSVVQGFRSGDMAKAIITMGTKIGTYVGRVAIRETGSFNITTTSGTVQGLNVKYCTMIQRTDGYTYQHHIQKARSA